MLFPTKLLSSAVNDGMTASEASKVLLLRLIIKSELTAPLPREIISLIDGNEVDIVGSMAGKSVEM